MRQYVLSFLTILAAAGITWAYSGGPPDAVTGAPGETTCADCHGNLNNGSGSATITAPGGYIPGDTLDITASVQNVGQVRWGFELTVLDGGNQPAGEIILTDAVRNKLSTAGNGRQYIKQSNTGTDDGTPGGTSWNFQWVAPDPDIGPVTFYMAGIAANSAGGNSGDTTYTTSYLMMVTDVTEVATDQLPDEYSLEQNFPNPFNPVTTIKFYLPNRSQVKIAVFNVAGQFIRVLHEGILPAGSYTTGWDGTDAKGNQVASGVYYYRLDAEGFTESKKMVLLK